MFRKIIRAATFILLSVAPGSILLAQAPPRIVEPVTESAFARLRGTTHRLATPATRIGRAPADLPMERILLKLKRSPVQQKDLDQLLADLQNPASGSFHNWLTPEQFGQRFGPAQQDLDAITAWLQSHGFQINEIAKGRNTIEFSGTALQVETAFRTEIHRYRLDREEHTANSTDIAMPSALEPVVSGVVSLHSFPHRSFAHVLRSSGIEPLENVGGGHALTPYDFATIYNVAPLWSGGFDGAGQTIAIPGRSNITLSDVATFRRTFGLPPNVPRITINGVDPGLTSSEVEADLDIQWAGGVAKGATVQFVASKSTATTDGVDLSSTFVVNDNTASVISLSFGSCEAHLNSENQYFNDLWAQAAAQGMSVFVSAGDSGSAGCDPPRTFLLNFNTTKPASEGLVVNGLASSPNNVAVGGTQFNDVASPSSYWNPANDTNLASARGYIPELVWNESSYTGSLGSSNSLFAGSGGVSSIYPTPAWQTGRGVPFEDPGSSGQHHRYLPDVSLSGSLHDGYQVYQGGKVLTVGGTSASSPAMAGIMALINQYTGGRNGNPNPYLYALAAKAPSVYHDVDTGTNSVPCSGGSPNCSTAAPTVGILTGHTAGVGFDLATGWGSVDADALAQNWIANGPSAPTIASLSPNPMSASSSVQNLIFNGTGFQPGATVKVGSATFTGSQITFVGPAQLRVSVTEASPGDQAVQVTNPDNNASNTVTLQVFAPGPPPVITSLAPNPMIGSNSLQGLTVAGTGFLGGLTLQIGSTTYTTVQLQSLSATRIQKSLVFTTASRSLPVKVTNPDGQSSNTVTLQVKAPLGQFAQQGAKLVGSDAVGAAGQGRSVAISGDGQTAILGGNSDAGAAGAAWIFTRSSGVWAQQGAKLVGDGAVGAQQGASVAISGDGNTAIVGGPGDNNSSGAAWIFSRTNDAWTQQGAKLAGAGAVGAAQQGKSVAISSDGNTVIVSGNFDSGNVGAVWIYTRSNGVWTQQGAKLVGTGAAGSAQQGTSVAISGDGNTAIVDGIADNSFASANWVYTRSNGVWTQQGPKLVGGGGSVALSGDGNTAIVGDLAQAIVFSRVRGVWSGTGANLTIGTGLMSASISGDGNTAIVGSSQYGAAGAAWVYKRDNGAWSQFGERLVGADVTGISLEGYSVAMSTEGSTAIVGDPRDAVNTGAGWVYAFASGPQIAASGVTNAAASLARLARGGLGIVYGSNFGAPGVTAQAGTMPFPLTLAGTSLTVGGVPAPLSFVNSGQINFQVPFETPPGPSADVVVVNADGVASSPVTVAMADYALGVYSYFRTPEIYDPVIKHLDGQLVTPANPAMPAERLIVYGTGIGKLTSPPQTGAATQADPPASAADTPDITIGGLPTQVIFAGLTPGAVGQAQLDFTLPAILPPSPAGVLPLVIQFPDDPVPTVNLYLQPTPTPDLTISKTHTGNFTQGQIGAVYTITVRNIGTAGTTGSIVVADALPAGLSATTIAGTGWTCTQPSGPCSRGDVLAAGAGFPAITLTVNVAPNAPASLTNTASVAGGGETETGNDTASDPAIVTPAATPDLTITKTHTGNFTPGQTGAAYTITAANSGAAPTRGTVTVSDLLPAGLTATSIAGTGWTCTQPAGPCTRSDVVGPVAKYPPLLLTVNVASNAAPSVTNIATIAGGGETNTGNNSAADVTAIVPAGGGAGGTFAISALAGTGTPGFGGDGGPATAAQINLFSSVSLAPGGVAVDSSGAIYLADSINHRIRKISTAGIISTFAGTGIAGFSGDGGAALSARMNQPAGLAFDTQGNLYIADSENGSVRKVTPGGVISTIAGTGSSGLGGGDGGPATSASMYKVYGVAFDGQGNLYITDTYNQKVRKVASNGIMSTFAGSGTAGFSGDGGQATLALLNGPYAVTVDVSGNVYIVDARNNRIRMVAPNGIITTIAGNGSVGFGGDGGAATAAPIAFSTSGISGGLAVDAAGNLYIADSNNHRIRKVTSGGIISTIAGSGSPGSNGDGGAALSATMSHPAGLALGPAGSLLFADVFNNRFRKLTPTGAAGQVSSNDRIDK